MTQYTTNEQAYFDRIRRQIDELRSYLDTHELPEDSSPDEWFDYAAGMKAIQGNTSNNLSFLACVLAKRYLAARFDIGDYDAAEKAQGAPGLDIDLTTNGNERIVGEIKTTVPHKENDLGSAQKTSFQKDFAKLNRAEAHFKFFFVTNTKTFEVVQQRYIDLIPGVELVLLTDTAEAEK